MSFARESRTWAEAASMFLKTNLMRGRTLAAAELGGVLRRYQRTGRQVATTLAKYSSLFVPLDTVDDAGALYKAARIVRWEPRCANGV
jgi:hypothetical protein